MTMITRCAMALFLLSGTAAAQDSPFTAVSTRATMFSKNPLPGGTKVEFAIVNANDGEFLQLHRCGDLGCNSAAMIQGWRLTQASAGARFAMTLPDEAKYYFWIRGNDGTVKVAASAPSSNVVGVRYDSGTELSATTTFPAPR
jgi:hypothetical protein